ncbi:MAG: cobyrinic acid a,c-diamide synthase [Deltaproteobacteria bacterium]|nr:MAG: cobyrinic acid a,c-diamide synthase [Deltaproteobacteria bacterium]
MTKTEGQSFVLTIAGLRGGSGKTFASLGLTSFFVNDGKKVCPFKKGPDYIDAGWLAFAAGRHCYNLDTFMCSPQIVKDSFLYHSENFDISVIEGNRGLYDAIDVTGKTSTAEIAKLVDSPVIVCIDCTKCTLTIAAVVMGLINFDPELKLEGVILNRVAGKRHAEKLRASIEHYTDVKVVGAIPKIRDLDFPERHMGLIPTCESNQASLIIKKTEEVIKDNLDTHIVYEIASSGKNKENTVSPYKEIIISEKCEEKIRIGIIIDEAFQFYYPENIKILEYCGAELVKINTLTDDKIPENIHALYIGGGFPESFAKELSQNKTMRKSILSAAEKNLPVYAECGGLIYLGEEIILGDKHYEMCGFFPLKFSLSDKPQGHGYVDAVVCEKNPFFEKNLSLKGHEFRYSKIMDIDFNDNFDDIYFSYLLDRGVGITGRKDGITKKNTLASYLHLHALGSKQWAEGLIKAAEKFKKSLNNN